MKTAWLVLALAASCLAAGAGAEPLAIDYRCGSEITLATGVPADGWTHAAKGRLPGILLAEDNVVNQKLAMRLLKQMGHDADLAVNGREAIERMENARYDVVLMDVQMTEMDGLDATREIVKRWPASRPRIVAMTANAMQGDREACLAAGTDDYLTKPVRVDSLIEALQRSAAREVQRETGS